MERIQMRTKYITIGHLMLDQLQSNSKCHINVHQK